MATVVTATVKATGGDYSSLSAWEAGEQRDLVAADEIARAECYNMQDTSAVVFLGWTTDATRYIHVYVPPSERHNGKWSTSGYRQELNLTSTIGIDSSHFIVIEGIQQQITSSNATATVRGVFHRAALTDTYVIDCIFKGVLTGTSAPSGAIQLGNTGTLYLRNTVIYDWSVAAGTVAGVLITIGTARMSNNTVHNCNRGFYRFSGTAIAKNNITQDCDDGYFGTFDAASTNNCSDIASDAPTTNARTGEVTFADEANDDFHLSPSDTVARNFGANLSADTWPFSTDIDGYTRTATWDIGADEHPTIVVTVTVKPSGGDYTSLSAAEAGEQRNLVTADEIAAIECYSMSDTTTVTIAGWTTDTAHYLRIYTPTTERHNGKWNTSKYRLELSTTTQVLSIEANHVRLDGLQLDNTQNTDSTQRGIDMFYGMLAAGAEVHISNCIIRSSVAGDFRRTGIRVHSQAGTGRTVKIWNCLLYGWLGYNGNGISCYDPFGTSADTYIYNCTIRNCTYGIADNTGDVAIRAKNCLVQDCTDGFTATGGFHADSTNNCSDIASDAPGSNPRTGEVAFVDEANNDLHLLPSDTVALGFGTDLSADSNLAFVDDIDGQIRSGSWDIGADERLTETITVTVKASGGDYSSLSAAEAGEQRNLVTADEIAAIECHPFADTTPAAFDGWTTDATRYIRIYASQSHGGVYNTNVYRLTKTFTANAFQGMLYIIPDYTRVEGLQFNTTTDANDWHTRSLSIGNGAHSNPVGARISDCIFTHSFGGSAGRHLMVVADGAQSGSPSLSFWNNILYDLPIAGYGGNNTALGIYDRWTAYVYNNTFHNVPTSIGISNGAYGGLYPVVTLKNNLISSPSVQGFVGTFSANSDYNATSASDFGPGHANGPQTNDRVSQTFTFVNTAGKDFHLDSSDVGAKGFGADLSADPDLPFETDIDGQTRSAPWDIGADAFALSSTELFVELLEGTTVRASWTLPVENTLVEESVLPLTTTERDSITDWANLKLRLTKSGDQIVVTQAYLLAPVAAGDVTLTGATIAASAVTFEPSTAHAITVSTITATSTANAPTATHLATVPLIPSTLVLSSPSVGTPAAPVEAAFIPSSAIISQPTLRYALTSAFISTTAITNVPSLTVGAVSVLAEDISSTVVLFPAIVGGGAETSFIASGTILTSPSIATTYQITVSTVTSGLNLNAPSLGGGVASPFISSASTIFAPSASHGVIAQFVASAAVLFAATFAYQLTSGTIGSTVTYYTVAVNTPSAEITGSSIASTSLITAPTVAVGAAGIIPAAITTTAVLNAPGLQTGAVTVGLAAINSGSILTVPGIAYAVIAANISSNSVISSPSVAAGAVTINLPSITSSVALTVPSLIYRIIGPTKTSSTVLTGPVVTRGAVAVSTPFIAAASVVGEPLITTGAAFVLLPAITSSTILFTSSFETQTYLTTSFLDSTLNIPSPTVKGIYALTLESIPSSLIVRPPNAVWKVGEMQIGTVFSGSQLYAPAWLEREIVTPSFSFSLNMCTRVEYSLNLETETTSSLTVDLELNTLTEMDLEWS